MTRDLQLVCQHESCLSATTNIADIFSASRRRTYFVEDQGRFVDDYFSFDFDLDELRTIRRRQRSPVRDPNYDDLLSLATVDEYLAVVAGAGRPVGVYVETKDPTYTNGRPR